jgi:hypothetical protein
MSALTDLQDQILRRFFDRRDGMSPKEIDDFRESLVRRLTAAAFPRSSS